MAGREGGQGGGRPGASQVELVHSNQMSGGTLACAKKKRISSPARGDQRLYSTRQAGEEGTWFLEKLWEKKKKWVIESRGAQAHHLGQDRKKGVRSEVT